MAGNVAARCNIGTIEAQSGNMERAVKHWTIAVSAGEYQAMDNLLIAFNEGLVSRNAMDSIFDSLQQLLCRDEKRSKRFLHTCVYQLT